MKRDSIGCEPLVKDSDLVTEKKAVWLGHNITELFCQYITSIINKYIKYILRLSISYCM